jgi:hypothetical protein
MFDPPAPESIPDSLHAYAAYLEERDGAADFERRTLAARERDTARFEASPACWDGPETYHTRLLLSAARLFGAPVRKTSPPLFLTRGIVTTIAAVPDAMARPVTLAAEAVGAATFLRLIGAVRCVFAGRPEVRDALEERVVEVLIDEIGHVSFNRLIAPRRAFAALRTLVAAIALGTRGAATEAEELGILPLPVREAWDFDPGKLPAEVRRRAFIA